MIDQNQIIQVLRQLQSKNNQPAGGAAPPAAPTIMAQPPAPSDNKSPSVLGFLGGLMDNKNDQGGVDPSWLTQMNQAVMKQEGNGNGYQPFPWQAQPSGQQMGQDTGGGIMKLLSFFL